MTVDRPEIHLVHSSSGAGGLEVLLPGIIRRLAGYRFSVFVIRPHQSGAYNVYKETREEIKYGSIKNTVAYSKLFRYVFRNRNSILHLYSPGPIALLTARLAGVRKLVYSIHGTRYWENGWQKFILKIMWRLAIREDYIFTANSEFSAEVFKKNVVNLKDIRVVYNPVDSTIYKEPVQRNLPSVPGKVIYIGRLSRGKNLLKWIDTAVFLRDRFPDMVFEIFGEGSEEGTLRKKISDEDLGHFISLKGFTDKPEEIYQSSDLLLFLSDYESFGNVVVESILCGTPVLAGDIPSMKEIFRDFPQFLIPADLKHEEIISEKIKHYGSLKDLTGKARDSFIKRFSPSSNDEALKDIYDTLDAEQA